MFNTPRKSFENVDPQTPEFGTPKRLSFGSPCKKFALGNEFDSPVALPIETPRKYLSPQELKEMKTPLQRLQHLKHISSGESVLKGYNRNSVIGSGAFAEVSLWSSPQSPDVVVKQFSVKIGPNSDKIATPIEFKKIDGIVSSAFVESPYAIPTRAFFVNECKNNLADCSIVMDQGVPFTDILEKASNDEKLNYAKKALMTFLLNNQFLEQFGLKTCDFKAANLVFNKDGELVICDHDYSEIPYSSNEYFTYCEPRNPNFEWIRAAAVAIREIELYGNWGNHSRSEFVKKIRDEEINILSIEELKQFFIQRISSNDYSLISNYF